MTSGRESADQCIDPLVNIVIPVYNGANYLAQAIESALAQTYPAIEVLVIDDGSTDGGATEAIARRYEPRIRYVRKPNGGVSSALNRGIQEMRGEWFSWLSHDDRFLPEKTATQIAFLARHPDVRVLATGLQVIDDTGSVTSTWSPPQTQTLRTGREVMDEWVYGCSLLIHRTVFERCGGFNEQNRTVQDLEMWLKIVHDGFPITMIPEVTCQWRHHGQSDSFRLRGAHLAELGRFMAGIAKTYPLDFFAAPGSAVLDPAARQEAYAWLAWQSRHRGSIAQCRAFLGHAIRAYPSPLARSTWRVARQYLQTLRATEGAE